MVGSEFVQPLERMADAGASPTLHRKTTDIDDTVQ